MAAAPGGDGGGRRVFVEGLGWWWVSKLSRPLREEGVWGGGREGTSRAGEGRGLHGSPSRGYRERDAARFRGRGARGGAGAPAPSWGRARSLSQEEGGGTWAGAEPRRWGGASRWAGTQAANGRSWRRPRPGLPRRLLHSHELRPALRQRKRRAAAVSDPIKRRCPRAPAAASQRSL